LLHAQTALLNFELPERIDNWRVFPHAWSRLGLEFNDARISKAAADAILGICARFNCIYAPL
jgi:hypothetical protein